MEQSMNILILYKGGSKKHCRLTTGWKLTYQHHGSSWALHPHFLIFPGRLYVYPMKTSPSAHLFYFLVSIRIAIQSHPVGFHRTTLLWDSSDTHTVNLTTLKLIEITPVTVLYMYRLYRNRLFASWHCKKNHQWNKCSKNCSFLLISSHNQYIYIYIY